ncbi:MAG: FAD binding domain-containing protein [Gemmatimonadales bacterium]
MLRLPPFTYLQPKSLRQALRMKAEAGPDSMYVAGGTDLYPNMKRRHQEPKVVVSLSGIRALDRITGGARGTGVAVGAGVTLTRLHTNTKIRKRYPALARAAELVSTPPLRNMGTFGGNLCLDTRCNYYNQTYEWRKAIDFCMKKDGSICWVAPSSARCWAVNSSDTAPVAVALGADFVLCGPHESERVVPAAQFFNDDGIRYLSKHPDEILTEVRLPPPDRWDATYWKLRRRGSFDFPVLGVAIWLRWENSFVADARVVLGAVASHPKEIPEAAQAIIGCELEDEAIAGAATAAFKPAKPMDNTDFTLSWRKEMTRLYVKGALEELRDRRRAARKGARTPA